MTYFIPCKERVPDNLYVLGVGLEASLWEGGGKWSLVNVLPFFLKLYCTSDGITLGIKHMKGSLEVCMFGSILIYFINVFLSC